LPPCRPVINCLRSRVSEARSTCSMPPATFTRQVLHQSSSGLHHQRSTRSSGDQSASPGVWGSPAYWAAVICIGREQAVPSKAYSFNSSNSSPSRVPTTEPADLPRFLRANPTVSRPTGAGRNRFGRWTAALTTPPAVRQVKIAWACTPTMQPTSFNLLHTSSSQAANNRDSPGSAVKLKNPSLPTVKFMWSTTNSLSVYGLLSSRLTVATPTISPGPALWRRPDGHHQRCDGGGCDDSLHHY